MPKLWLEEYSRTSRVLLLATKPLKASTPGEERAEDFPSATGVAHIDKLPADY